MKYLKHFENINFDDIVEEEFDETIFEVGDIIRINKEKVIYEKTYKHKFPNNPENWKILPYKIFIEQMDLSPNETLKITSINYRYDGKQIIKLNDRPNLWYLADNFIKV